MRLFIALLAATALFAADPTTASFKDKPAIFTWTLPTGWTVQSTETKIVLFPTQKTPHIQIWAVGSSDVADAEKTISSLIVSEVKDFKVGTRSDLKIGETTARVLIGTGLEADDGDPSNAEVTIFPVGKQLYVLVAHGEGEGAKARHDDVKALVTSIKPLH